MCSLDSRVWRSRNFKRISRLAKYIWPQILAKYRWTNDLSAISSRSIWWYTIFDLNLRLSFSWNLGSFLLSPLPIATESQYYPNNKEPSILEKVEIPTQTFWSKGILFILFNTFRPLYTMSTETCLWKAFGVVNLDFKTWIFEFEFQGIYFELFINTLPVVVGTSSNKGSLL